MINVSSSKHDYKNIVKNIKKCIKSGWIGLGKVTEQFENSLSKRLNKRFIAVNNGTNSLHLGLHLLNLKKGDKVLLPSFTFFGCIQAILSAKLTPVICDVDDDVNLSCKVLNRVFDKSIKGIMAVHYGGKITEDIIEFKNYKVKILEDAAQVIDSKINGKYGGTFGDVGSFSFDSIKNISTPDMGGVCFEENQLNEALAFRNYGIIRKRNKDGEMWWDFDYLNNNVKYNPNDIASVFGLEQLENLKKNQSIRKKIWKIYQKEFEKLSNLKIIQEYNSSSNNSYFSYLITIKNRNDFAKYMLENGVYTVLRFPPFHIFKKFKKYCVGSFSNSQNFYDNGINLPMHNNLTDNCIDKIVTLVKKWAK